MVVPPDGIILRFWFFVGNRIVRRNPFWPGRRTDDWRVIRGLARRQRSITVSCAGLSSGVGPQLGPLRYFATEPASPARYLMSALPRKQPDCCEHAKRREGPNSEVNALIRSPRRRCRSVSSQSRRLGGVGAFGGYGLARISAFTYRRRLRESWAHSRCPSDPTHRGYRTR